MDNVPESPLSHVAGWTVHGAVGPFLVLGCLAWWFAGGIRDLP